MSDSPATIRVAYGSVPKDGGTFTFYRNIRPALASMGVEIYCVAIGPDQAALWDDDYVDPNCVLLEPRTYSIKRQSKAFVRWCQEQGIHIVVGVNSWAILSAIPHLPRQIRAMARCANAFDHGYRITMAGGARLSRIVALTPRLERDLIRDYGADPARIRLIPNGVSPVRTEVELHSKGRMELGFLGRLEHGQKGVRYLPDILRELDGLGVGYRLRIAGKGVDGAWLKEQLAQHVAAGKVLFLGSLTPYEVNRFLGGIDIQLFTSHFEGCPNALLEGMMASAVPMAYSIDGITDYLIDDGRTGIIHQHGQPDRMAASIARLSSAPDLLLQMKKEVRSDALERFSVQRTAEAYRAVFEEVIADDSVEHDARPWSRFNVVSEFKSKRFGWLPVTWWNYLRIRFGS